MPPPSLSGFPFAHELMKHWRPWSRAWTTDSRLPMGTGPTSQMSCSSSRTVFESHSLFLHLMRDGDDIVRPGRVGCGEAAAGRGLPQHHHLRGRRRGRNQPRSPFHTRSSLPLEWESEMGTGAGQGHREHCPGLHRENLHWARPDSVEGMPRYPGYARACDPFHRLSSPRAMYWSGSPVRQQPLHPRRPLHRERDRLHVRLSRRLARHNLPTPFVPAPPCSSAPFGGPGDVCESAPCQNGGTCLSRTFGFVCSCPQPYSGSTCENGSGMSPFRFTRPQTGPQTDPCTSHPCRNGGSCAVTGFSFNCTCPAQFLPPLCNHRHLPQVSIILSEWQSLLPAENPCTAGTPCDNGGTCIWGNRGNYSCRCPPQFTGPNCSQSTALI